MVKSDSIYSASLTGCGFMVDEMTAILPLLMGEHPDADIKKEIVENNLLHINSESTRARAFSEFKKRFSSMPRGFWDYYLTLDSRNQNLAMFYVMLKTYRILFDLHFDVTTKKWLSVAQKISKGDVMNGFYAISAKDSFVDSWSDITKQKISISFLNILRKVGIIKNKEGELQPVDYQAYDFSYCLRLGDPWFLDACLLFPYQIDEIKRKLGL